MQKREQGVGVTGEKAGALTRKLSPATIRAEIRDEVASIQPFDEMEETKRTRWLG